MTVEHDSFDGGEGFDGDRPDPLMAVLTGEPLPVEARADAAFMAAHRSAEADVALLREQLGLLGEALAGPVGEPLAGPVGEAVREPVVEAPKSPAPRPAAVRTPVRRRRPFVLAVRAVGVACAIGVFSVTGWAVLRAGGGVGASSDAGSKAAASDDKSASEAQADMSAPGYLACARLVAEGDVTAVDPVPGTARDRVTLRVTRYLKPDKGRAVVTFVMDRDSDPRLRVGDHALVSIPSGSAAPDVWSVGDQDVARSRAWIDEALPQSRAMACR
ncbi:hypothetical protein [Streptomyces sp. NPDC005017]|uniref:hypothetical protein n=1 Tax=Streptomyces sp. NPDC005017 TaxID=3364706 RepID=UPI003683B25E